MTGGLAGARVLITGGSRTIAAPLVDQLVRAGAADVVVVDTHVVGRDRSLAWANDYAELTLVHGDLRDSELVSSLTQGVDVLFHQSLGVPATDNDCRIDGVSTVFAAAVRGGVRKVVFGSLPRDGQHGADQVTAFAEGLLRRLHAAHGLDYVALRYADVYGPGMEAQELFCDTLVRWMRCIDAGQTPVIPGSGARIRDPVFVADVARANVLAAEAAVTDEVCRIATGTRTSLHWLARLLITVMDAALEPSLSLTSGIPAPHRRDGTAHAHRLLGFRAETGLEDGLRQLVDWWRAQRGRQPQRDLAGARPA